MFRRLTLTRPLICAQARHLSSSRRIRVYTKTGDKGTSQLFTGERREKHDEVFHALGDTDELNSVVGVAREHTRVTADAGNEQMLVLSDRLVEIQSRLMDVGSAVATPLDTASDAKLARAAFGEGHATALEQWIDEMDDALPPLKNFILPGGGLASAHLHHARSVCRRAERRVAPLVTQGRAEAGVGIYLNRLSDFFFVAARFSAQLEGHDDTVYQKDSSNE